MSDSVPPHRRQPTRLPRPWDSPGKNTGVGCHFLLQCIKVISESVVAHSCPTPSNPIDCSPLGPSVHGIFQARVLEWGAIAFSLYLPKRKERMCPYKVWYLIQNNFINNLFTTDILIRLLLPQCYRLVCFNSHLHNKLLATGINFCKNLSLCQSTMCSVQFSCSVVSDSLRPHEL